MSHTSYTCNCNILKLIESVKIWSEHVDIGTDVIAYKLMNVENTIVISNAEQQFAQEHQVKPNTTFKQMSIVCLSVF